MSFRLFTHRLYRHARWIVQNLYVRNIEHQVKKNTSIFDPTKRNNKLTASNSLQKPTQQKLPSTFQTVDATLFRFGQKARRLFVDNILKRVTPTYSSDVRIETAKKFLYGDPTPLSALVGVSLASGTGILTKDDELESICWEIREAICRLQNKLNEEPETAIHENFTLDNFNIGPPIAKGCAAVVYAASFINNESIPDPKQKTFLYKEKTDPKIANNHQEYTRSLNSCSTTKKTIKNNTDIETYPLALKMMFNYDIQSNATSILRAMYKETIPARNRRQYYQNTTDADNWEKLLMKQTITLPAHPNIVKMFSVFCAQIPNLSNCDSLYPMALPLRLNPHGYGRNMSLFLVMKRYNQNLRDYLTAYKNHISMRIRLLLFAQLLEAVAHMYRFGIAHRDLKSDNILIEQPMDNFNEYPALVVSDFGCCLADKWKGLIIPYSTIDFDKGGNTALMAPEIIQQTPGPFSILNYTKSDLWACGAIAYEILGQPNPFYYNDRKVATINDQSITVLSNINYCNEDLPPLSANIPPIVQILVKNCLERNPKLRLQPDIAANVMQLFLWAPNSWLQSNGCIPDSAEILKWLLSLTTKILCDSRIITDSDDTFGLKVGRQTYTEYLLISSFLMRAHLKRVRCALDWIQLNINCT